MNCHRDRAMEGNGCISTSRIRSRGRPRATGPPIPTGERVKVVEITKLGEKAKAAALEQLHDPPPSMAALNAAELQTLRNLLRKVRSGPTPPS